MRHTCDRGDLMNLFGERHKKFDLVSHEETLHDGTAQSVMNEEIPRDRPVRRDIDSQEVARPQNFVMGNDETEMDLSVESRSFVNRVSDQVRTSQKRISNVAGDGEEHFTIW